MVIWGLSIVTSFARNFSKSVIKITFLLCELLLNAVLTDVSAMIWSTVDLSNFLVQIFEQSEESFYFFNMEYSASPYGERGEINVYSLPFDLINFSCAVL